MCIWKVNIVYYVVVYKYVLIVEYNIVEGVFNNVIGILYVV